MLPIVLSILFPGLGQFYYGKNVRGILMLLAGITPLYPIALVWSVIDVIRLNKRGYVPVYEKRDVLQAVLFLAVIILCWLALVYGSARILFWYADSFIKPQTTVEEGNKIVSALMEFREANGRFPSDLNLIIVSTPIRASWIRDAWEQPYIYEVGSDGQSFELISTGRDRTLGTKDDILFKRP